MREWNEPTKQEKDERTLASLAMPQQVPPVDRTASGAANVKDAPGVEAGGLLKILLGAL
ncbi:MULTISPECIES: hypothetical protein [unclassified Streptomyces]|uniref:hypothetical protein n=1 Tax=unclassified Streptomyces TaxID=2593676 RepID=UPI0033C702E3